MINDELIGRNLTLLRGSMSQKELAERMRKLGFKWSQATVWSIEKGERPLRLTESEALGSVFGIHAQTLTFAEQSFTRVMLSRALDDTLTEIADLAYRSCDRPCEPLLVGRQALLERLGHVDVRVELLDERQGHLLADLVVRDHRARRIRGGVGVKGLIADEAGEQAEHGEDDRQDDEDACDDHAHEPVIAAAARRRITPTG